MSLGSALAKSSTRPTRRAWSAQITPQEGGRPAMLGKRGDLRYDEKIPSFPFRSKMVYGSPGLPWWPHASSHCCVKVSGDCAAMCTL